MKGQPNSSLFLAGWLRRSTKVMTSCMLRWSSSSSAPSWLPRSCCSCGDRSTANPTRWSILNCTVEAWVQHHWVFQVQLELIPVGQRLCITRIGSSTIQLEFNPVGQRLCIMRIGSSPIQLEFNATLSCTEAPPYPQYSSSLRIGGGQLELTLESCWSAVTSSVDWTSDQIIEADHSVITYRDVLTGPVAHGQVVGTDHYRQRDWTNDPGRRNWDWFSLSLSISLFLSL